MTATPMLLSALPAFDLASWLILLVAVFTVAFFYSSVGYGGATGYLAVLALLGVAPASARVAVLMANVLVAGVAWWRFWKAGHSDERMLLWFAVVSVPFAWLGSRLHVSRQVYEVVLGGVLTAAGISLLLRSRWQTDDLALRTFFPPLALLIGIVLGFLAGLTGIGGGVTNMKITFGEGLGFAIPVEQVRFFLQHRDAFAYDNDNPSNAYRYLEPPRRVPTAVAAKP